MKGKILCPLCMDKGRKPKTLGYYEDVVAQRGYVDLFCKSCRKSVRICLTDISLDR